ETQDENGNFVGSLSYSISKVLLNGDAQMTYREVFDQIKAEMSVVAPNQAPQVEGDIDNKIFGGKGTERVAYYKVSQVIDSKTSILGAGQLLGMYNDSKVGLYPAGTKNIEGKTPIAVGKIANATLTNSDIIWETEVKEDQQRKGLVFMMEKNFGDMHLKV